MSFSHDAAIGEGEAGSVRPRAYASIDHAQGVVTAPQEAELDRSKDPARVGVRRPFLETVARIFFISADENR